MINNKNRLSSEQGSDSVYNAKDMFLETNPEKGIFSATGLLDYTIPMSPKRRQKEAALWDRLRSGTKIKGILVPGLDKDEKEYLWIEFELPRGVEQHKVILLSDRMVEFFQKYQTAQVSIRFTHQQLLEEATRIEDGDSMTVRTESEN